MSNQLVKQGAFDAPTFVSPLAPVERKGKVFASELGSLGIMLHGKEGRWKIEKQDYGNDPIEIKPIHFIRIPCKDFYLFKDSYKDVEEWLELLFLDEENRVCSMFLKKESMGNFMRAGKLLDSKNINYRTQVLIAKPVKRTNQHGDYYALEFEVKGTEVEKEIQEEIDAMMKDRSSNLWKAPVIYNNPGIMKPRKEAANG